ncbi:nucleotidyltransferase family protein [Paradesulfitobacterium ferrireducens]|uniref:nucleotidyltransferase family protein n=1 Tax=Paradesulfitobacterium ferrireducens TaxID=2816476 RepID=UPI001A8DC059|nr:nucleotidyltransferase family protein [Paradesulfitobacterium ferrireducens]
MRDVSKVCIRPDATLLEALQVINNDVLQIALVVNDVRCLQGTVTDGDIRRAILKGLPLNAPVTQVMNGSPITIAQTAKPKEALFLMQAKGIHQIPAVNESGMVVGIHVLSDLIASKVKPHTVVIMAGGMGTRLRPLTQEIPKPMLKVGDKPILQTIIEQLRDHGLIKITLAVNYLAEQIEEYFGDGNSFGVKINYLKEKNRMGTAGALTLIEELPEAPLLVMNGDILTNVDFSQLLQFHNTEKHAVTMCVRNYDFRVPYGVVILDEDYKVSAIEEKPLHSFLVSAGIYVINPDAISLIPRDSYFDMPSFLELAKNLPNGVGCFPIHDYWIDIGENKEYQRANADYGRVFNEHAQDIRAYSR